MSAPEEKPVTATGKVKWFNESAGFGFLTFDDGAHEGDIFIHSVALDRAIARGGVSTRTLFPGQRLSFRVQARHRDGKPFATHLREIPETRRPS